jgi:hypothetical protein
MGMSNGRAIRSAGPINTSDLTAKGIANPAQSERFYNLGFEQDAFGALHRREIRKKLSGEIDRIFIGARQMRLRTEGVDDGYRAKPTHSAVTYNLKGVRIPFEITEETLDFNIEEEGYEDTVVGGFAKRFGLDMMDLGWNGDSTTTVSDPDYDFLSIADGWLTDIEGTGNTVNGASYNSGVIAPEHFFQALFTLDDRNQSRADGMRWMMTKAMHIRYMLTLTARGTAAGDQALNGKGAAAEPLGIPVVYVPFLGNNVVLGDPKNFISVLSENVLIRSTTEGREAVLQNKRIYAIHANVDFLMEEAEAAVLIQNLVTPSAS